MTHPTYHLYWLQSGLFTGATFTAPLDHLAGNTPPGCGAICGVSDPASQRVDTDTGELVAYQPPQPSDTELVTWYWHDGAGRWVPTPTTAALAQDMRAERDRRLTGCDWVRARATDLGEAVPAAWLAYRASLRDVPSQVGFPNAVVWPTSPT